ncbi:MAG: UDP-glucose--hexose-1-phosphate uridylyltransferase [Bacteroidales bacterium]|nr:UDP-glucose--hexose-1-phosphate uridylyltransferase [Bacteroidales bacterium]
MKSKMEYPHRRYNALTGEWILVSPHRATRPWQGQQEGIADENKPQHDKNCYLCPGNERAGGQKNPDYANTFVFKNDFSALLNDTPEESAEENDLFIAKSEKGICRVICFSPRHDLTIPEMEIEAIEKVIDLWQKEFTDLGNRDFINHVQIFENKGAIMGCSNPHPHGQIWAQSSIPDEVQKECIMQDAYFKKHETPLLLDYLSKELQKEERIVVENDSFVALVPYWATWPFETMILPKRAIQNIGELSDGEKTYFADIYRKLTIKYDNMFNISFPYSAGIHQAPTDGKDHPEWQMHMHFYPPLLRSATVKKFMVGYEMLANAQRDITAEQSAQKLRELALIHYKQQ